MTGRRFTCACCGRKTQSDPYGSFEICPVCFWQDDPLQLANPRLEEGTNPLSLVEGQACYQASGASTTRRVAFVRPPLAEEMLDANWRPFDDSLDTPPDNADFPPVPYWLKT